MALVKFVSGVAAKFNAATADANTLYFLTDTKQIFKGSTPFTPSIKVVTSDPETNSADVNTIYVNSATGRVSFFNGTSVQTIVKAPLAAIGNGSEVEIASTKAVIDYVTAAIAGVNGNADALKKQVSANTANIATIQGEGAGSIKAAQKAAEAYANSAVNTLATGAVATNTAAITKLNGTGEGSVSKAVEDAKTALQANIDKKANKATTLAGYGITDAYTRGEADTAIATAVNAAGHLKRSIVDALPAVGEADEHTIYMVPKKVGAAGNESGNSYLEYMLVNGKFEQVGDSTVDLTDYAKSADVTANIATAKSEAIAAARTETTNQIADLDVEDTAVDGKYVSAVSEVDGKVVVSRAALPAAATLVTGTANGTVKFNGTDVAVKGLGSAAFTPASNYATAAQGAKADSALQAADVIEGSANGTIAVKGTDVEVHGLGSAAFVNTSEFDKTGAADKALGSAKSYADGLAVNYATVAQGNKADQAIEALTWGTL